jgi:flagellar biosynthesis chaperone FliJ
LAQQHDPLSGWSELAQPRRFNHQIEWLAQKQPRDQDRGDDERDSQRNDELVVITVFYLRHGGFYFMPPEKI